MPLNCKESMSLSGSITFYSWAAKSFRVLSPPDQRMSYIFLLNSISHWGVTEELTTETLGLATTTVSACLIAVSVKNIKGVLFTSHAVVTKSDHWMLKSHLMYECLCIL